MSVSPKYAFLLVMLPLLSIAQYLKWPLNTVKLTGNYGELRPNHFHAGLDFSGDGNLNSPIYAVKTGYISRIKVSPYGYGKVLYISHYDGKLSVYAHQSRFNDSIEAYVKKEQYKKLSYEIELFPEKNELQITEGELIGYMGNTGGSTGPHLHFELRDEITEIPLNPLLIYKLQDTIKPICTGIAFFNVSDSLNPKLMTAINVKNKNDSLYCANDTIVVSDSNIAVAFSGYDIEIYNDNPNNIYEAKLFINDTLFYHHQLNYIPFDLSNYVNEFTFEINKRKYQKCFVPSVYPAYLYKKLINSGRFQLKDTLYHKLNYVFTDEYGNSNHLTAYIKTKQLQPYSYANVVSPVFLNCKNTFNYSTKTFTISFAPKSVYNHGSISIKDKLKEEAAVYVSMPNTFIRQAGTYRAVLTKSQELLAKKLVIKNNSGVLIPKIEGNIAEVNFKTFGKLELKTDTIGPKIKTQLSLKKLKKTIKTADHITFIITDNLSGIANYYLYINDEWNLAEYDAKSDALICNFDANTPKGELKILVTVQDKTGNISAYKLNLIR